MFGAIHLFMFISQRYKNPICLTMLIPPLGLLATSVWAHNQYLYQLNTLKGWHMFTIAEKVRLYHWFLRGITTGWVKMNTALS